MSKTKMNTKQDVRDNKRQEQRHAKPQDKCPQWMDKEAYAELLRIQREAKNA